MEEITPGYHLYEGPDGVWRYCGPGDTFVRITGPHRLLGAMQRMAQEAVPVAGLGLDDTEVAELGALARALGGRGLLSAPAPAPVAARRKVHVEGDNPIGEAVAALLQDSTSLTLGPIDEGVVARADLVVSCAGWLPDRRWRQLDTWCSWHLTPWHRCHAEGTRWFAGPLFLPGQTASYADLRGRRLAAAPAADELLGLWSHLDRGGSAPPVPWPSEGGIALVAGLVAADVLAWQNTGAPAAQGVQLEVDPARALVEHHPVLPLPVTA